MPKNTPEKGAVTFARSLLAGGAATLVDLSVLGVAVGLLGMDPRVASVPALLAGAIAQFFGNRVFAFRAASGSLPRQAAGFAATEAIALVLNALLYHVVASAFVLGAATAVLARAATTNVVYLAWSYPAFRRVFQSKGEQRRLRARS